jgi:hypothetical protein
MVRAPGLGGGRGGDGHVVGRRDPTWPRRGSLAGWPGLTQADRSGRTEAATLRSPVDGHALGGTAAAVGAGASDTSLVVRKMPCLTSGPWVPVPVDNTTFLRNRRGLEPALRRAPSTHV